MYNTVTEMPQKLFLDFIRGGGGFNRQGVYQGVLTRSIEEDVDYGVLVVLPLLAL